MDKRHVALLVVLAAPACAAEDDTTVDDDLPALSARLLALAPDTIDLAAFDIRRMVHPPAAPTAAFDANELAWAMWAARAQILRLDPLQDASFVAMTASVGSCGITDDFMLAVPARDADRFATRVDDAIRTWRREHPELADDHGELDAPADPALSSWVPLADGTCTIVQVTEFEQVGVTLRTDGSLLLHGAPFGDACRPRLEAAEPEPSP